MTVDPAGLDPVIHAQARLRVVVTLAALPPDGAITFPRLQQLLDLTAGNLATHLRKLEDARYVGITKTHEGRLPVTFIGLTSRGRVAFEDYTATLRALLDGGRTGDAPPTQTPTSREKS